MGLIAGALVEVEMVVLAVGVHVLGIVHVLVGDMIEISVALAAARKAIAVNVALEQILERHMSSVWVRY